MPTALKQRDKVKFVEIVLSDGTTPDPIEWRERNYTPDRPAGFGKPTAVNLASMVREYNWAEGPKIVKATLVQQTRRAGTSVRTVIATFETPNVLA